MHVTLFKIGKEPPVATCEQRDTGRGHPDEGTAQRTNDYLQIHGSLRWNGRLIENKYGIVKSHQSMKH